MDFGDWSGYNWNEVREKFGVHPYDWLDEIELGAVPNGENGVQFRARVEACLFEIIRRHPGETAAIFSHGGVIRMMLAILLDLPLPKTNSFEIEYTSVTQVALHPHLNEIELLNFTPWRDWVKTYLRSRPVTVISSTRTLTRMKLNRSGAFPSPRRPRRKTPSPNC